PVWDGNETWLVLGGAGLLAAFPLAYSVILSALYLPIIFMLIGLIFRGVAFEFRFKALEHERHFWDKSFIGGSVVATFFHGVSLGAFMLGLPVVDRQYAGGAFDWFAPFPLFTGLGLVAAFALLGAAWLILKSEGKLQERAHDIARWLAWILLGVIVVISIWTPLSDARIAQRWFSFPNILWFSPVPILVGLFTFLLVRSVTKRDQVKPFIYTLALIFLGYSGLG